MFNLVFIAVYWAAILFSMKDRIGAQFGAYDLFDTLSLLRSFFLPILVSFIGAFPFFMGTLKASQYLFASLGALLVAELLGNTLAVPLYALSFGEAFTYLETSFHLLIYGVFTLMLWGLLWGLRGILRAVKRRKAALSSFDMTDEYEQEKQERLQQYPAVVAALPVYKSSGIPLLGYWLRTLLYCVFIAFILSSTIVVVLLKSRNPQPVFVALGLGAIVSLVITLLYGSISIEVGTESLTVKRRGKVINTYAFADTLMTPLRSIHLIYGIIPLYTQRKIVMTNSAGGRTVVLCRNFSEKSYVQLMDALMLRQRAMLREGEASKPLAPLAAQGTGETPIKVGRLNAAHLAPAVGYRQPGASPKILPMPGEEDFVSIAFTVNKEAMVATEQKRYRNIIFGLLASAVALYTAWYFLVYRVVPPLATNPIKNLPLFTAVFIGILFAGLPTLVMLTRFFQEKKRIPVSIIVENTCFNVDGQQFQRNHISHFKMTAPGTATIGTTSHRMHLSFTSEGKRHIYTIGSGIVAKAQFPDYNLLYQAFDAQRVFLSQPPAPSPPAKRMIQTTIQLTPYTVATVRLPRRQELGEIAGIISNNNAEVMAQAEEIVNNPYRFAQAHHKEFEACGFTNTALIAPDAIAQLGISMVLQAHHYCIFAHDSILMDEVMQGFMDIITSHGMAVDLSLCHYNPEENALGQLGELSLQLHQQGWQIGDLNSIYFFPLFLVKTAEASSIKALAQKAEWNILF